MLDHKTIHSITLLYKISDQLRSGEISIILCWIKSDQIRLVFTLASSLCPVWVVVVLVVIVSVVPLCLRRVFVPGPGRQTCVYNMFYCIHNIKHFIDWTKSKKIQGLLNPSFQTQKKYSANSSFSNCIN